MDKPFFQTVTIQAMLAANEHLYKSGIITKEMYQALRKTVLPPLATLKKEMT